MTPVYICPGKIGDVLNILPLVSDDFFRTKEKPTLIVSREYASLVSNLNYLNLAVWEGHWQDLKGCLKWAKENFTNVINLSTYGKDFPFQHKTPSFLLEPWERVDRLRDFDKSPLVITGRNTMRELKLLSRITNKRPYVLLADHGESSPFAFKNDLFKVLTEILGPTHDIIRLSEFHAEHFLDVLALYEKAAVIVSVETAHLHLTRACRTPVIAFVTDKPSRWHGSPMQKRFIWHCRYGDFQLRIAEFVEVLGGICGQSGIPVIPTPTLNRFGYNPTVIEGFDGMVYRYHPVRGWKTRLALERDGHAVDIGFPAQFQDMSFEDARLFWYRDKVHISFVIAREEFRIWNAVNGYGELVIDETGARVGKVLLPKYGQNTWGGMEKNWVFFERDGKLFCVYANDPEQVVLEVSGEDIKAIHRSESPEWAWGKIRGGCLVRWDDDYYLRFFHSHTTSGPRESWIYFIGASLMEAHPPFKTVAISRSPIISGDETLNLECRHWKPNVVFPGGAFKTDKGWRLFYGFNDCECRLADLTLKDLKL